MLNGNLRLRLNILRLATASRAGAALRRRYEPMRLRSLQNRACYFAKVKSKAGQALGSMSVRVPITPFLHKKSPSFEVLYTIRVFEATPQYLRTLRLVSEVSLRLGHARGLTVRWTVIQDPHVVSLPRSAGVRCEPIFQTALPFGVGRFPTGQNQKSTSFEVLFWFW